MGDFFHGWRRKIGIVTLVLACASAALWIRSQYYYSGLAIPGLGCLIRMWVDQHILTVNCWWCTNGIDISKDFWPTWNSRPYAPVSANGNAGTVVHIPDTEWGFSWGGFEWVRTTFEATADASITLKLPHWSVVMPLTLLSAILLLGTPKKRAKDTSTRREQSLNS